MPEGSLLEALVGGIIGGLVGLGIILAAGWVGRL